MPSEVSIGGENSELVLKLERWERVHESDDADASWIAAAVELRAGSVGQFKAKRSVSVLAGELGSFRRDLAAAIDSLTGEARLETVDGTFGVQVSLVLGRGEISMFVKEQPGAELAVEAGSTDQSYLQATLRQLDGALAEFDRPS